MTDSGLRVKFGRNPHNGTSRVKSAERPNIKAIMYGTEFGSASYLSVDGFISYYRDLAQSDLDRVSCIFSLLFVV